MALKPLADRVVVAPMEAEEKTQSGIFLPDTAKEKPQQGKVIAVGQGRVSDNGELVPMTVKVGDTVLYAKYAGSDIKLDGKDHLIVRESDILAIVED